MIIYTDGGARGNPGPAGAGVVFGTAEKGKFIPAKKYKKFLGRMTNNQAEYTALIMALKLAKSLEYNEIECRTDSELMARQVLGKYKVKNKELKELRAQALELIGEFTKFSIKAVKRKYNREADKLVNLAIDKGSEAGKINKNK